MKEKIKCPNCGSDKLDSFRHSGTGSSNKGKKPNGKGPISYECQNCEYEFTEDNLNKNE